MSKHFLHSGKMGDVIYALPAIRRLGGGILHLVDTLGFVNGSDMQPHWRESLVPLLECQPYINGVRFVKPEDNAPSIDLNAFRHSGQDYIRQHLADAVGRTFGCAPGLPLEPWLDVDLNVDDAASPHPAVVIARSARYHNSQFPWARVREHYGSRACFVGTPEEHSAFVKDIDWDIPYVPTSDLHETARLIQQSLLFVGNQSAPLAIAEGLGKPIVCEVCAACPNCILDRDTFVAGWDAKVTLPDLEKRHYDRSCATV